MFEIELDIFSGMPNPTWRLSKEQEAELYELLAADPEQATTVADHEERFPLGYRGLIVRRDKPDGGVWDKAMDEDEIFPNEFRVGVHGAKSDSAVDWLMKLASRQGADLDDELREMVSRGVELAPEAKGPRDPSATIDEKSIEEADEPADEPYDLDAEHHETWWACGSNTFLPNASTFNRPEYVRRNNCYCFGSNHLANVRFALPGRRGGRPARRINCDDVVAGLRADGWTNGCQPRSLTIALVIWPNFDYHFYRLVTSGPYWWWGHKPGGTRAKYTDDCGNSIFQFQGRGYAPNNICRGSYTVFCDYFYQDNWTALVA